MSNTEVCTSTIPSGLKYHDEEHCNVAKLGGTLPIQMISVNKNNKEGQLERATVTTKFTDKANYTHVKFTGNIMKQAVCHTTFFYRLVAKMELT